MPIKKLTISAWADEWMKSIIKTIEIIFASKLAILKTNNFSIPMKKKSGLMISEIMIGTESRKKEKFSIPVA